jgi:hypothetical protein
VWSTEPSDRPPLLADLAEAAAAATPERDVVDEHHGDAIVATYTVRTTLDGTPETVVIADTDDGRRTLAVVSDPDLAARAMTEEVVGMPINLNQGRR